MAGNVGKFKVAISGDIDDLKKLGKDIQEVMQKLKAPEMPTPKMPDIPTPKIPTPEIPTPELPKKDWGLAGAIGDQMKGVGSKITGPLQDAFSKVSGTIGEKVGGPISRGLTKVIGESGVEAAKDFGSRFKANIGDIGSEVGQKVGAGAKSALKGITAGVGVAAAGVATLATGAVKAYADYEQLTGGVEKLFGDSADSVGAYAAQAYKTAGLSANQYMEQATAVAAFTSGGIITIGGKLLDQADVVDTAISDMADNANIMGTDLSVLQNAYSGFAKGNFAMLDQLKIGFGGSQQGMADLVNSLSATEKAQLGLSESFVATAKNVKEIPYDQLVGAIHLVQDNLNITGTTAKEASGTISGSFMSMQSGWQNVITGFGVGGEFLDSALAGFTTSITDFVTNVLTILPQVFEGITKGITELIPVLLETLNTLIPQLTELLVTALPVLVTAIIEQLPALLDTIVQAVVALFPVFLNLVVQIALALVNALPALINSVVAFLISAIPQLISAGIQLLLGLVKALPAVITALVAALPQIIIAIVTNLVAALPQIISGAVQLLMGIIQAIPQIVVALINAIPQLVSTIVQGLLRSIPQLISAGWQLINGLVEGLLSFDIWGIISGIGQGIVDGFKSFFGIHSPSRLMRDVIGKQLGAGIGVGLDISTDGVLTAADELSNSLSTRLTPDLSGVGTTSGRGNIIVNQKVDSPKTMLDIQLNTQKGALLADSLVGAK